MHPLTPGSRDQSRRGGILYTGPHEAEIRLSAFNRRLWGESTSRLPWFIQRIKFLLVVFQGPHSIAGFQWGHSLFLVTTAFLLT